MSTKSRFPFHFLKKKNIYIYIYICIYIIFNNYPKNVHGCQQFSTYALIVTGKKLAILPMKHVLDLKTIINEFSIYDQLKKKLYAHQQEKNSKPLDFCF